MTRIIHYLLNFVSTPTLSLAEHKPPKSVVLSALIIVTLAMMIPIQYSLPHFTLMAFFTGMAWLFFLFVEGTCYDTAAQLLGKAPQGIALTQWLILCHIPTALQLPIFLLKTHLTPVSFFSIWGLVGLIITLYSYRLQFITIQTRYTTTTLQSWLILLSPLLFIITLGVGTLLLFSVLLGLGGLPL